MAIGLIPGPLGRVLTPTGTSTPVRTVSPLGTFRPTSTAAPITIRSSALTPMRSISNMTVPVSQPSGGIVAAVRNMVAAPVSGIHSSGISFGGSGTSTPMQTGAASRFGTAINTALPGIVAPVPPSGADNTSQPSMPMAPLQASATGQPSFDGGGGGGAPDDFAAQQAASGMSMPSTMSFSPTLIAVGAALALGVGWLLLRRPSAAAHMLKV